MNENHDERGRFSSSGGSGGKLTSAARERVALNKQIDVRHIESPSPARPVVTRHADEPSLGANSVPRWEAIKQTVRQAMPDTKRAARK